MANLASAIQELREQRKTVELQIDKLTSAISLLESITGLLPSAATNNGARPKRVISAAARRHMAHAQRARRSEEHRRANSGHATAASTKKRPRVMSAAARRKIAAAQRARWAKVRRQLVRRAA
jgi:hypothetical protein